MELREYWQILRRRWWIPAALVGLVLALSLWQMRPWQPRPPTYASSMRFLVGVMPAGAADSALYDPRYYAWLTSEYLVDDFTEVVRSELFTRNVSARLAEQALELPAGLIQGSAATGKQHRIITLSFNWPDRGQLETIAAAAAAELVENAELYFRQLGTDGAGVTLLDGPTVATVGPGLRAQLELPLRLALALAVGIGLVFLLDYVDTSVRDRRELEQLGLPVLGEIPRHK
jgi:capsular polysaccharide biosynthesis protein